MGKKILFICAFFIMLISFTGCPMSQENIEYELDLSLSSDESGVHIKMVDPVTRGESHELVGELLNANMIWVKRRIAQSNDSWDFVGYVQRPRPDHLYDTDCKFDDYYVDEGVTYEYCLEVTLYDNETHHSTKIDSITNQITAQGGYGEAKFDSEVSYVYDSETSLFKIELDPEIQYNTPDGVISPFHIGIWNGEKKYDWCHTLTPSEMENGIYLNSDDIFMPELGFVNETPLINTPVNIAFWMEFTRFDESHLITTWRCFGNLTGDIVSTWDNSNPVSITITK